MKNAKKRNHRSRRKSKVCENDLTKAAKRFRCGDNSDKRAGKKIDGRKQTEISEYRMPLEQFPLTT